MSTSSAALPRILVGSARIDLQSVQVRDEFTIDEIRLDGGDIRIEPTGSDGEASASAAETRIRAMMSEPNLNRLVTASLPATAPIRSLHVALLSGRARISGKALVSIVPFPFSIEAVPRVENGVRIVLDCKAATLGMNLPRSVVEILEQKLNEALSLDLSELDVPLWIDEIKCEPGRLTAVGRAQFAWPPLPEAIDAARMKPLEARRSPDLSIQA